MPPTATRTASRLTRMLRRWPVSAWMTTAGCAIVVVGIVVGVMYASSSALLARVHGRLAHAEDTARDLSGTVREEASAGEAYRDTGDVKFLSAWAGDAHRAMMDVAELRETLHGYPAALPLLDRLDDESTLWPGAPDSAQDVTRDATADPTAAPAAIPASPMTADVHRLLSWIDTESRTTFDKAMGKRAQTFDVVEGGGALLIVVVVAAGLWADRRVVGPARHLQRMLASAASGLLDTPIVPRRGLFAGTTADAERLRRRMRTAEWQARRDREALEQNSETVLALRRLLTSTRRPGHGVEYAADLVAAEGVIAGDFYGVLALPDSSTAVFLGDISGHGVNAGLLAARVKYAVECALTHGDGPLGAVDAARASVADEDERFATLVVAVLDPGTGRVHWANAGHPPPLLRHPDGSVTLLHTTGPAAHPLVGGRDDWTTAHRPLTPGDTLVLYTDGLVEARSAGGTELGDTALLATVAAHGHGTPPQVLRSVFDAMELHGADWHRDDTTVIAAVYTG